ncbi:MAG: pseudouridine synthase [Thermoleophilia bacterium]|nr:pseudouridine synthase [Thermoleophilia bacterium]
MPDSRDPFLLPGDTAPVGEKLQKFLSASGVASRRHAEVLIQQGRVTVNGTVAKLGMRVVPADTVRVGGVEVGPQAPRLFMLNKPTGIVTTLDDPQGRPTVAQLVPDDVRVYPVGRLDVDTSGLLLLTNDGELAHRLMHPSFGVTKTYRVLVEGHVKPAVARRLATGVELEDGPTAPGKARVVDATADRSVLELEIHEGRNRQVRRMCDAIGHPVIDLVRIAYGPLTLGALAVGTSRPLLDTEVRRLRKVAGLAPPRSERRAQTRAERRAAQFGPGTGGAAPASEQEVVDGKGDADAAGTGDRNKGDGAKGRRKAAPSAARGGGNRGGARGHRGQRGRGSDGGSKGGSGSGGGARG